jgi:hypothetical protein
MSEKPARSINYHVLRIFSVVLIVAGVAGFVLPPEVALTSGAPDYNLFHLAFGALGLLLVVLGAETPIRGFNVVFGLIDLYQALASKLHLFPEERFQWKPMDDLLHVVIGAGLVAVGVLFGRKKS